MEKGVERKVYASEDRTLTIMIGVAKTSDNQGIIKELARSSKRAGVLEALVLNPHTQAGELDLVTERLIAAKDADQNVVRKILLKVYLNDNASEKTKNKVTDHLFLNDDDKNKSGFLSRLIRIPQHA